MGQKKLTLVLGASLKVDRYANRAIRKLRAYGHPVMAVGLREGMVDDVAVVKTIPTDIQVDTVTMYLNADNQKVWEVQVLALHPKRIIFNPGAENAGFVKQAQEAGIETLEACTLVMLGTGQF